MSNESSESSPQQEAKPIRLQFETDPRIEKIAEDVFSKLNVHGHKAIYKTAVMVVASLVERSFNKDFVRVRILECGALEFETPLEPKLSSEFPLGTATKVTRLDHGMQPDPGP